MRGLGAAVRVAEGALPAVVIGTVHWGAPTLRLREEDGGAGQPRNTKDRQWLDALGVAGDDHRLGYGRVADGLDQHGNHAAGLDAEDWVAERAERGLPGVEGEPSVPT